MHDVTRLPALREIIGALIFGANRPITSRELRQCIQEVAEADPETAVFAEASLKDIDVAVKALHDELQMRETGFGIYEVAGGWRLQSNVACGRWLKHLLKVKPQRLSQPALETMAIIAYRQPISKADIEAIRGVGVSHIIKALMEVQLVKIAGRSELPGRPFLYGTTSRFLEHFGLKSLQDLEQIGPRVFTRKMKDEIKTEEPAEVQGELFDSPEAQTIPDELMDGEESAFVEEEQVDVE
jgi:segregation and condensation protein B